MRIRKLASPCIFTNEADLLGVDGGRSSSGRPKASVTTHSMVLCPGREAPLGVVVFEQTPVAHHFSLKPFARIPIVYLLPHISWIGWILCRYIPKLESFMS